MLATEISFLVQIFLLFADSRSSIHRELKKHEIYKWPLPKKVNIASSTSNLKHVKEVVPKKRKKVNDPSSTSHVKEVVLKTRKKVSPSCFNPSPMHTAAAAVAAHTITNITP